MAGEITIQERPDSREWSGGSLTLKFNVIGTADDAAARDAFTARLEDELDDFYKSFKLYREQNFSMEPVTVDEIDGMGIWLAAVRYNPPTLVKFPVLEIGQVRIRCSTKGSTMHIMSSLQTVGAYGSGASTGDNGNLIDVTADGVEGVDIGSGSFDFTVEKVFDKNSLPSLTTIYNLSSPWHTNSGAFTVRDSITGLTLTLSAGECLFKGAEFGEPRGDFGVLFSYDFSALPNATGLSVGSIGGISKKGHEYMWVRYERAEIGSLKVLGQKPKAVYVEKVYKDGDFSALNLS